jgi:hypothetical protein
LLHKALEQTESLFGPVRKAFGWVHKAAQILGNAEQHSSTCVRKRFGGLLGSMSRHRAVAGQLSSAVTHFIKVTRSYWPGLFHCYDIPLLPRTNNDLEQFFGAQRHHERRVSGQKRSPSTLVLRGSVRLAASAATRLQPFGPEDLVVSDLDQWKTLRRDLEQRRNTRRIGLRFRRNPKNFLASLEQMLVRLTLPP